MSRRVARNLDSYDLRLARLLKHTIEPAMEQPLPEPQGCSFEAPFLSLSHLALRSPIAAHTHLPARPPHLATFEDVTPSIVAG